MLIYNCRGQDFNFVLCFILSEYWLAFQFKKRHYKKSEKIQKITKKLLTYLSRCVNIINVNDKVIREII